MPARPAARAWSLLLGGLLAAGSALSQPPSAAGNAPQATASPKAAAKSARTAARPLWADLSARQKDALAPLATHWNGLNEAHKRKWLALSRNFDALNPQDQATLHERMTAWATLSAKERAQARLNFAEIKRLAPADERKAKWEAYQALSEEERRRLAASAAAVPASTALPVRPVPVRKLAPVPEESVRHPRGGPRIQLAPPTAKGPLLAPAPAAAEAAVPPAASSAAPAAPTAPAGDHPAPAAAAANGSLPASPTAQ